MFLAKIAQQLRSKIFGRLKFFQSNLIKSHFEDSCPQSQWKKNMPMKSIVNKVLQHQLQDYIPHINNSSLQTSACLLRCYDLSLKRNYDFYLRIFKNNNVVTYLPSAQYLESSQNLIEESRLYNRDEDKQLKIYRCKCRKCNSNQERQLSKNSLDYGVSISECQNCSQIMILSDSFNWFSKDNIEAKLGGSSYKYDAEQVERLIERNLSELRALKV